MAQVRSSQSGKQEIGVSQRATAQIRPRQIAPNGISPIQPEPCQVYPSKVGKFDSTWRRKKTLDAANVCRREGHEGKEIGVASQPQLLQNGEAFWPHLLQEVSGVLVYCLS
jgi:hypothetical protein